MLYFFEDFVLDPDRRELRRGGALIAVQPQVFDLLEYLVTNRDRVVSKDDILQAVWGGRIVSESALTTRINAIRTAVGDDGDQQRLIRTLPRKGIRFVGVVQQRGRPLDEAAVAADAKTPEQKTARCDEAVPPERRQLTIASCELLLGAAGMDPEDLREVIQGYHKCVVETIQQQNGLVANTHGNTAVAWPKNIRVAVNVSAKQLRQTSILSSVVKALTASALQPNRLEIEITETAVIDESEQVLSNIRSLRDLGVRIALDDFGTGYSSLTYLRRLSPDSIKIDGLFVREIATNAESASIVKSNKGSVRRYPTSVCLFQQVEFAC